jgi:hypothetical protein
MDIQAEHELNGDRYSRNMPTFLPTCRQICRRFNLFAMVRSNRCQWLERHGGGIWGGVRGVFGQAESVVREEHPALLLIEMDDLPYGLVTPSM